MNNIALVITSIAESENKILKTFANQCLTKGIPFLVVGDKKSPKNFQLDGCTYLSIDDQNELHFTLSSIIPDNHYARKNLGYLKAYYEGAEVIVETDDDNYPMDDFWSVLQRSKNVRAYHIVDQGWLNVYSYYTDEKIWPRGFPLEKVNCKTPDLNIFPQNMIYCPIQQGLANDNPDVDSVYRLTQRLPITFSKDDISLALGFNAWSPFNSQNTLWFEEAFPLMYLPSYCSFRMTDIWRSFIAQRIAWENDWSILYHKATVRQERNGHNLLKNFKDEIPGYLNNQLIIASLMNLKLTSGPGAIGSNLKKCYQLMIKNSWVGEAEEALVEAWVEDIEKIKTAPLR